MTCAHTIQIRVRKSCTYCIAAGCTNRDRPVPDQQIPELTDGYVACDLIFRLDKHPTKMFMPGLDTVSPPVKNDASRIAKLRHAESLNLRSRSTKMQASKVDQSTLPAESCDASLPHSAVCHVEIFVLKGQLEAIVGSLNIMGEFD